MTDWLGQSLPLTETVSHGDTAKLWTVVFFGPALTEIWTQCRSRHSPN